MKKLVLLMMLCSTPAWAANVTVQGGWEHTPSSKQGDAGQLVVRADQEVYQGLGLAAEYGYHGPSSVGGYGSFSGHHLMAGPIYRPEIKWQVKPYVVGLAGWSWWEFSESADTKMRGISVDAGDSFSYKVGLGADWPISDGWAINLEWSYFQTDIKKAAHYADGTFSNILDTGNTLGHNETALLVGVRKRF